MPFVRVNYETNSSTPEDANNHDCVFPAWEEGIFNETLSHLKFENYSLSIPSYHLFYSGWSFDSLCSRYKKEETKYIDQSIRGVP